MARKSEVTTNPIRIVRLADHKSLEEFAISCHVHLQAVYLNEMGMYPTILPSILGYLTKHYDEHAPELEEQYEHFVQTRRYDFGMKHEPYHLNEPSLNINPLHDFRHSLGCETAFGFAKAICVNPTVIRRVEKCQTDSFPGQLNIALREILLPVGEIEELEYRHQEYYYSGVRLQSKSRT